MLATDQGPQLLIERADAVGKAWRRSKRGKELVAGIPDLPHFELNIDTARIVDRPDDPQIVPIAQRIDGPLLDRIDDLWNLGKGFPTPEQQLRAQKQIMMGGWQRGDLVAWNVLCWRARKDLYPLGDDEYEAVERYCAIPGCNCDRVTIQFLSRHHYFDVNPATITVHVSGVVTFNNSERSRVPLEQLWDVFRVRHPEYQSRFAHRKSTVQSARPRFFFIPAQKPTHPKTGRNEPCPCASGRKYKRCCGAESSIAGDIHASN